MTSEHSVEVELRGNSTGRVTVDGHDLSSVTRALSLHAEVGRIPHLQLDLHVIDTTRLAAKHVEVHIDPAASAFLERAGWTPPPGTRSVLARDRDGCPCEHVDVSTSPAEPETVLGRTVPTCPIHATNTAATEEA